MTLQDDIALLSRVPMLGQLERDALRLVAFSAEARQLKAGDVLFRKGDPADGGYVVVRGAVTMMADDGETSAAVVGEAGLIGEIALVSETLRPATAVAREPATVLRISRAMFRRTLEEYPQAAQRLARAMAQRVGATARDLARVKAQLDKAGD